MERNCLINSIRRAETRCVWQSPEVDVTCNWRTWLQGGHFVVKAYFSPSFQTLALSVYERRDLRRVWLAPEASSRVQTANASIWRAACVNEHETSRAERASDVRRQTFHWPSLMIACYITSYADGVVLWSPSSLGSLSTYLCIYAFGFLHVRVCVCARVFG